MQKPKRIVAGRNVKQGGVILSAERGPLITLCCAVNGIGNSVAPMLIFSRVHFKDHFPKGAPFGSVGGAYPLG